ncbi:LOW QUALITY PROTEIN: hypothetical protein IFM46972_08181 [Aspergillus udagawae]|uniref:Uncharacterized protein n=1 Tax=Aspergillus udagawae TaxID=91492 RepID=A0A8H3P6M7_9EURO|nr:LOW QUALITY PROTEIN: hypothetical protein IFM46972_08181 [Aspergillus udagawae]
MLEASLQDRIENDSHYGRNIKRRLYRQANILLEFPEMHIPLTVVSIELSYLRNAIVDGENLVEDGMSAKGGLEKERGTVYKSQKVIKG